MTFTALKCSLGTLLGMRREERKEVRVRGWITGIGHKFTECFIFDISRAGARILVGQGTPPDEFNLYLSPTAQSFRKCRVRWRRKQAVGVEFVRQRLAEVAAPTVASV
jgi:hypothetical protein